MDKTAVMDVLLKKTIRKIKTTHSLNPRADPCIGKSEPFESILWLYGNVYRSIQGGLHLNNVKNGGG